MTLHEVIIFTNPSARAGYDTRSIFKLSLTGLNSEFSFSLTSCLTKTEEPSLSYYLPIAGGKIIGFIPFPRVLVLCEMQLVSSRIWTRVTVFISYDDNHYTTGTSTLHEVIAPILRLHTFSVRHSVLFIQHQNHYFWSVSTKCCFRQSIVAVSLSKNSVCFS